MPGSTRRRSLNSFTRSRVLRRSLLLRRGLGPPRASVAQVLLVELVAVLVREQREALLVELVSTIGLGAQKLLKTSPLGQPFIVSGALIVPIVVSTTLIVPIVISATLIVPIVVQHSLMARTNLLISAHKPFV